MKDAIREHYDTKYAQDVAPQVLPAIKPRRFPRDRFEACVTFFPRHFESGHILELGAGDGRVAHSLLSSGLRCDSYTVTELSEVRLKGLGERLTDSRVRILRMDAEQVAMSENGRYAAIIMIALIEHLVDPLGTMTAVRKLLRPGGFVYIDTPNIAKYSRRIKLLFGRFPSTASVDEGLKTYAGSPVTLHDEGHLHYFTYRSLSRMLRERCQFSRTLSLGYSQGGGTLGGILARLRPELFSEILLLAYA